MSNSRVSQRESIFYDGTFSILLHNLRQLTSDVTVVEQKQAAEPVDETKDIKEQAKKSAQPQNTPSHIVKMFKVFI